MRTFLKIPAIVLLALFPPPLFSDIVPAAPHETDAVSGVAPILKTFLLMSASERRELFNNEKYRRELLDARDAAPTDFSWECTSGETGEFSLVISEKEDLSVPADVRIFPKTPEKNVVRAVNFRPGTTYFWQIRCRKAGGNDSVSPVSKFTADKKMPRLMNLENCTNLRDLGGKSGIWSRQVRQGKIFRSGALPGTVPADGEKRLWKTELFLNGNPENESVRNEGRLCVPVPVYKDIFSEAGKEAFARVFRVFCEADNYPLCFCSSEGVDAAGTLAFVLAGALGVGEDELRKDWEISAAPFQNYRDYFSLRCGFETFGDKDMPLYAKIERYLNACGVSREEIETYREIMLSK